jgi:hypothetical protein
MFLQRCVHKCVCCVGPVPVLHAAGCPLCQSRVALLCHLLSTQGCRQTCTAKNTAAQQRHIHLQHNSTLAIQGYHHPWLLGWLCLALHSAPGQEKKPLLQHHVQAPPAPVLTC